MSIIVHFSQNFDRLSKDVLQLFNCKKNITGAKSTKKLTRSKLRNKKETKTNLWCFVCMLY